jgi:hypothetical protein
MMMVASRFPHSERSVAKSRNPVADLEMRFTSRSRDVSTSLDMT